jgi:enolase
VFGREFANLAQLDKALIDFDGTADRSRLGANAIVGVSMAVARAAATSTGASLWETLTLSGGQPRLPLPHFNVINGGAHAPNPLDFQEFMLAPVGAVRIPDAVRAGAEIYARLRGILLDDGLSAGLGDEGGFAPDLTSPENALRLLVRAIEAAGYSADERGVMIALDPAASQFHAGCAYTIAGERLSSTELVERYRQMVDAFPICSIEDGMGEDDRAGWRALTAELGERIQLVGDDNFVTSAARIHQGAREDVANAALIKVNQVGTVSETLEALQACRDVGFGAMVSHRSGETTDDFIADLAVGCGCGQLKSGAPARGERVAKYNRLLEIAAAHPDLPFGVPARNTW